MGGVAASSPVPEEDIRSEPVNVENRRNDENRSRESEEVPDRKDGENKLNDEGTEDPDDRPGLIKPDGSINWDCPCLGGMAHGPCGPEFRAAFSCFHYSTADQKGSDCLEPFMAMQTCFQKYPEIFGPKEGEEEENFDESVLDPENSKKDVESGKSDTSQNRLSDADKTSIQIK